MRSEDPLTPANARSALDRVLGALLGLAVGDAIGTAVEFKSRGAFPPVTDMVGGGPFGLEPGQWTDDTSMALCLATSLVERNGFDARDQMERYCRWLDEGYLSSTGRCFDMGVTVRDALQQFKQTGEPFAGSTHPRKAGNGSIMRLAPVVMFFRRNREAALHYAAMSSMTTHATTECVDACRLMASMLLRGFAGGSKEEVLLADRAFVGAPRIEAIARGQWQKKAEQQIAGSGYVVQSLEAAAWSVWATDSFEAAILRAVNLGDDADTTGAVAGQLAGAVYGKKGIPVPWLERLALGELIEGLAVRLSDASQPT